MWATDGAAPIGARAPAAAAVGERPCGANASHACAPLRRCAAPSSPAARPPPRTAPMRAQHAALSAHSPPAHPPRTPAAAAGGAARRRAVSALSGGAAREPPKDRGRLSDRARPHGAVRLGAHATCMRVCSLACAGQAYRGSSGARFAHAPAAANARAARSLSGLTRHAHAHSARRSYKQLLFYAAKLPVMAAEDHAPENKVEGCVSQVRLVAVYVSIWLLLKSSFSNPDCCLMQGRRYVCKALADQCPPPGVVCRRG